MAGDDCDHIAHNYREQDQDGIREAADRAPRSYRFTNALVTIFSSDVAKLWPSDRGRHPVRTILILAANPKGTDPLRLDEEVKRIEQSLERAKKRKQFKVVAKWAVTDDDLRRALLDNEPQVVHFAGHGTGDRKSATGRDLIPAEDVDGGGLAFEDDVGHVQLISGNAVARLFKLCSDSVKCVVLNACYSEAQANAITRHIDFVVGMKKAIGDPAAIKFAVGFYDALFAGRDFETSFNFGCNAIDLKRIPEHLTPVLKKNVRAVVGNKSSDAEGVKAGGKTGGRIRETSMSDGTKAAPPSASTANTTGPIRLFYSYSHKDEALRDKLEEALTLLRRQGLVAGWHDRRIGAGDHWKGEIDRNLKESHVILLLVSFSFIASDYCWDIEVKQAIERDKRGEAKVIPVILRSCDWQEAPFGKLQCLPKDGKPIMTWTNKDKAWTDVAKGIRKAVEAMIANPPNLPSGIDPKAGAGQPGGLIVEPIKPLTENLDPRGTIHPSDRNDDERRKEIQVLIESELNRLL
jgi:TIR domain/CHAT domain